MSLELFKNIMNKPPSSPLKSWIFEVCFFSNDGTINRMNYPLLNTNDISMIPIKVDLPSIDTHIVTLKSFGTEKSFPVIRKHGGDTTLDFYIHSNPHENEFIVYNFFKNYSNGLMDAGKTSLYDGTKQYIHKEFLSAFDKIVIEIYDGTDKNIYTYTLYNCIVTKIDEGTMNYETDDVMKYSMTVHYDDWYISQVSGTLNPYN